MKKNKIVVSLFFVFCSFFSINAENEKLKGFVGNEIYEKFNSTNEIIKFREDGVNQLQLLPDENSEHSKYIAKNLVEKTTKNFPYTYEALYKIPKELIIKKSNSKKSDITLEDVSVVCRSVSKMQGMTYYSTTKKKNLPLYKQAFMIDGKNSKNRISDQNFGNADGQISFCLQDDASFGINHYKLSYFQDSDTLLCDFELTDEMGIGPFKAIYPGKMKNFILVNDCGDCLLLYLVSDLDAVKFPGIKGQIKDSITSRMTAIYNWFIKQF